METVYTLDASAFTRRFSPRQLLENEEEVGLAIAELDFAPHRLPEVTRATTPRYLLWQGRILQLDRNFESGRPTDSAHSKNVRLCVFLTDCVIFARPVDAFSSEADQRAQVTSVISFAGVEVVPQPNVGAFRNITTLVFDGTTSIQLSFSSSVERNELLSKLVPTQSGPASTERNVATVNSNVCVPLFDDIGMMDTASLMDEEQLLDVLTDAEIDDIIEKADSISKETESLIASSPILQNKTASRHFSEPPSDSEVVDLLKMAKNVEGILNLISQTNGGSNPKLHSSSSSGIPLLAIHSHSDSAETGILRARTVSETIDAKRVSSHAGAVSGGIKSPTKVQFNAAHKSASATISTDSRSFQAPISKSQTSDLNQRSRQESSTSSSKPPGSPISGYQKPWRHNSVSFSTQSSSSATADAATPNEPSSDKLQTTAARQDAPPKHLQVVKNNTTHPQSPLPSRAILRNLSPAIARRKSAPSMAKGIDSQSDSEIEYANKKQPQKRVPVSKPKSKPSTPTTTTISPVQTSRPTSPVKSGWNSSPSVTKPAQAMSPSPQRKRSSSSTRASVSQPSNRNESTVSRNQQSAAKTQQSHSVSFENVHEAEQAPRGRSVERRHSVSSNRSFEQTVSNNATPAYMRPTRSSQIRSASGGSLSNVEKREDNSVESEAHHKRKEISEIRVSRSQSAHSSGELASSPKKPAKSCLRSDPSLKDTTTETKTKKVMQDASMQATARVCSIGVQTSPPHSRSVSTDMHEMQSARVSPNDGRRGIAVDTKAVSTKGYAAPTSSSHSRRSSVTTPDSSGTRKLQQKQQQQQQQARRPSSIPTSAAAAMAKKVIHQSDLHSTQVRSRSGSISVSPSLLKPTVSSLQRSRSPSVVSRNDDAATSGRRMSVQAENGPQRARQPSTPRAKTPQAPTAPKQYTIPKQRSMSMDVSAGVVGKNMIKGGGRHEGYMAPTISWQLHSNESEKTREASLEDINGDLRRHSRSGSSASARDSTGRYRTVSEGKDLEPNLPKKLAQKPKRFV
ncbi:hypothetical protein HDU78_001709 [Chytriomyces hyalinus]|nr:hypothetical protein HDU78_001709 [Chytriomyces hyalinus]